MAFVQLVKCSRWPQVTAPSSLVDYHVAQKVAEYTPARAAVLQA